MGRLDRTVFLFGLILGACGDDDSTPVADAGTDRTAPAPTTTSTAGSSGSTGGAPTPTEYRVDCPVGTTVEFEPNDAPGQANSMNGLAFCGVISPGADVDYARFETPPGKKLTGFVAVIDGQLDFDLVVNGKTLKAAEVKKFEAGAYVVKVFTKDAKQGKYRFSIQFEP